MKMKHVILILALLIIGKLALDVAFKIRYTENNVYDIHGFTLNDSLTIDHGKVVIGKNIKGNLEAAIFPEGTLKMNDSMTIEYVYLRFYPAWFNERIAPNLGNRITQDADELLNEGKQVHESNFKGYMHINDYPLVRKDFLLYVIKFQESNKKIRSTFAN